LNASVDVSRLALEITGDQPGKEDPRTMVAEVALVEGNRLKGNWPITLEQFSKGGIIELPLSGPLGATEVLMASTRPAGRIRIERVLVNGNPVSDTVQTAPGNDWLVRNVNAQPLAFFVGRGAVVKDRVDFSKALASIDPSRCVLFQKTPPGYQPPGGVTADPGGQVEIRKWEDEEVRLQVTAQRPGYLVMTQAAYPGWKAWVNDKKVPILQAYGFLMALPIGAGSHQVRFTYQEPWLVAGLIIAPLWLLGLLFWTFRRKKSTRQ